MIRPQPSSSGLGGDLLGRRALDQERRGRHAGARQPIAPERELVMRGPGAVRRQPAIVGIADLGARGRDAARGSASPSFGRPTKSGAGGIGVDQVELGRERLGIELRRPRAEAGRPRPARPRAGSRDAHRRAPGHSVGGAGNGAIVALLRSVAASSAARPPSMPSLSSAATAGALPARRPEQ